MIGAGVRAVGLLSSSRYPWIAFWVGMDMIESLLVSCFSLYEGRFMLTGEKFVCVYIHSRMRGSLLIAERYRKIHFEVFRSVRRIK